jgi:hypothetical protein
VRTRRRPMVELYGLAFLLGAIGTACAEGANPPFSVMAPVEQYLGTSASAEVTLARTAAPTSISGEFCRSDLGRSDYGRPVDALRGQ